MFTISCAYVLMFFTIIAITTTCFVCTLYYIFFGISWRQRLRGCSVDLVVSRIFREMFAKQYAYNLCHWIEKDVRNKSTSIIFLLLHIIYLKWSNDSSDKLDSANFIWYFSVCWETWSSSEASSVVQKFFWFCVDEWQLRCNLVREIPTS